MPYSEVLVGVDSSDESLAALRWAAAHAWRAGGRIRAISVWDEPVPPAGPGQLLSPAGEDTLPAELERGARERLDDAIASTVDHAVEVVAEIHRGNAGTVLVERATDTGAELLALGNAHHGALRGALAGSVAQHCIRHGTTPIVLVPNHDQPVTTPPGR